MKEKNKFYLDNSIDYKDNNEIIIKVKNIILTKSNE